MMTFWYQASTKFKLGLLASQFNLFTSMLHYLQYFLNSKYIRKCSWFWFHNIVWNGQLLCHSDIECKLYALLQNWGFICHYKSFKIFNRSGLPKEHLDCCILTSVTLISFKGHLFLQKSSSKHTLSNCWSFGHPAWFHFLFLKWLK